MKTVRKGDLLEVLLNEKDKSYGQVKKICKNENCPYYILNILVEEDDTNLFIISDEETRIETDEIISHVKIKNNDYKSGWCTFGILQLPDRKFIRMTESESEDIGSEDSERSIDETDSDLPDLVVPDEQGQNFSLSECDCTHCKETNESRSWFTSWHPSSLFERRMKRTITSLENRLT